MRIAFGERFYTVEDYKRLLDANVTDVILIDPGRAEGVTGMWKIIQLAARYNVSVDAHSFSSAINTAASIHLSLCAPLPTMFELKPVENAMHHELVRNPFGTTTATSTPRKAQGSAPKSWKKRWKGSRCEFRMNVVGSRDPAVYRAVDAARLSPGALGQRPRGDNGRCHQGDFSGDQTGGRV